MTVDSELVIKMLLFLKGVHREVLLTISSKTHGIPRWNIRFLSKTLKKHLESGKEYKIPDVTWDSQFIKEWLKLSLS